MKNLKNNKMQMIAGMMLLFCSIDLMGVVGEITSYVSNGSINSWTGNIDKSYATIQKSRNVIRKVKVDGNYVTVYLHGGMYLFSEPINFPPKDSRTESYPIIYSTYTGEKPIIWPANRIMDCIRVS